MARTSRPSATSRQAIKPRQPISRGAASDHHANEGGDTVGPSSRVDLSGQAHKHKACGHPGCSRKAECGHMGSDGKIGRFCLAHRKSEVITTTTAQCQHMGCNKVPKYGPREGPLSFCQHHKRAGMYTNRNGQVLVATRDGNAPSTVETENVQRLRQTDRNPPEELDSSVKSRQKPKAADIAPGKLTLMYRKLCEVPGCQIQPSYGVYGSSRPQFCVGHKKEGMVGLKNRPCIFPGCPTRPHYGVTGERPVFCATHKKDGMVHLLKQSITRRVKTRDTKSRRRGYATPDAAPSESKAVPTRSGQTRSRGHRENIPSGDENDSQSGHASKYVDEEEPLLIEAGTEAAGDAQPSGATQSPKSTQEEDSTFTAQVLWDTDTTITRSPTPPAASLESAEVTSNTATSDGMADSLKGTQIQRSRLADTLATTPSVEAKILQKARESARSTAEATGRRARVPSLKALEASGKLRNEGVQWLTKEKKEEQARFTRELKEQRKAAAAAGLRAGQVLEAGVLAQGDVVNADASTGTGASPQVTWRKLTAAEILQSALRSQSSGTGAGSPTVSDDGRGLGGSRNGGGVAGMAAEGMSVPNGDRPGRKRKETVLEHEISSSNATESSAASPDKSSSASKRSKKDASADRGVTMTSSTTGAASAKTASNKTPEHDTQGGGATRQEPDMDAEDDAPERLCADDMSRGTCEIEGRTQRANFGTNGHARYW